MPIPAIIAVTAATRAAAALAAKNVAKKVAPKVAKQVIKKLAVPGKASGAKAKVTSTGKAKSDAASSKMYDPPKKGTGKPAYKNVIKEERVNTKKSAVESKVLVKNILGKKFNAQEKRAVGNKAPNLAKSIDREEKIRKGVRTQSPSTSKVPTKKPKLSK